MYRPTCIVEITVLTVRVYLAVVTCIDQVLLEAGADPDARDYYDNSALLLACETGSYNIAKLLVESNASVELLHTAGRGTAMHQVRWTALVDSSQNSNKITTINIKLYQRNFYIFFCMIRSTVICIIFRKTSDL